MDQQAEKDQTERVTGRGRGTTEEIAKWNQMTALRFQTRRRHQTSPASLRGPRRRTNCTNSTQSVNKFMCCLLARLDCLVPADDNVNTVVINYIRHHHTSLVKFLGVNLLR